MTVDDIKNQYSMVDILNRLNIQIKRGFCNCPLHTGDRTASFKVYPKSFYCFGCGKGGDIIYFVEEYCKLDFKDACEWIAGETLSTMSKRALVVEQMKRKAIKEKQLKLKRQLKELRLAEYWNKYQAAEPYSDEWINAYNEWQKGVYKQETLMKELGL